MTKLSRKTKYQQLKLVQISQLNILFALKSGEKRAQVGEFQGRETGSSLQLCRTQTFSLYMLQVGMHASTSCLSCDSASLRLQFPPVRDAEAELGNKSLSESPNCS